MNEVPTPRQPKPKGFSCPTCQGVRFVVASRSRPCAGLRVRYLRCEGCQTHIRTEERMRDITRLGAIPEGAVPPSV